MRRTDREITDFYEIADIIKRADVVRVAFCDEYPYILPFNFGIKLCGEKLSLYIHGAFDGKKIQLIKQSNRVGFETDRCFEYEQGSITSRYESAVGYGTLSIVTDSDEKKDALELILSHYGEKLYKLDSDCINSTNILRLDVINVCGKKNVKNG